MANSDITCCPFPGVPLDRGQFLLCERQYGLSADGRRRVSTSLYLLVSHQVQQTCYFLLLCLNTPPICLSSAVVSWVCGLTPSCTEAPPPNVPLSTTSRSPPGRTSPSTVWRSGPSSSRVGFSYFSIFTICSAPRPKPSNTPKSVMHHWGGKPSCLK